jgi:hypothetical protein
MGVLMPSSNLMKSGNPETGVRADKAESSEGNVDVIGVFSCASFGFTLTVMLTSPRYNELPGIEGMTLDTRTPAASSSDGEP